MKHLDDELLSLLALGEPMGTPADAEHLASCGKCAGTLSALERTVHAATIDPAEVELATPGPHNWAAIHQALGLSGAQTQDPLSRHASVRGDSAVASATAVREERYDGGHAPDGGTDRPTSGGPVKAPVAGPVAAPTPLRSRTARRWVAMAAAAGILFGAAAAWAAYSFMGRGPEAVPSPTTSSPRPVVIAQAPLQPLQSYTASGKALVEKLPDGTRQLVVQLSGGQISGFREVWVISPDLSKLVSLGVLDGEPGVFAIPDGLNLADYPIVDVSNEPFDGNPSHSSDSIARGKLTAES